MHDNNTSKSRLKLAAVIVAAGVALSLAGYLLLRGKPEPPKAPQMPPQELAALSIKLTSGNDEERLRAAEAIPKADNLDAMKLLFLGLDDKNFMVKAACLTGIGRIKDPEALSWVMNDCAQFPDAAVRKNAVQAMVTIDHKDKAAILLKLASDDPAEEVKMSVFTVLSALDPKDAIPAFEKGMRDESWTIRESAIASLGAMATPDAMRTLVTNCGLFPAGGYEFWLIEKQLVDNADDTTLGSMRKEWLAAQSPQVRMMSANVIGTRYSRASDTNGPVEDILNSLSTDDNARSVQSKIWALKNLAGKASGKALADLSATLAAKSASASEDIRLSSWDALAAIWPKAKLSEESAKIADWRAGSILGFDDNDLSGEWTDPPKILGSRYTPDRKSAVMRSSEDWKIVSSGLRWLLRHQEPDGRWSCAKHNPYNGHIPLPEFTFEDEVVDASVTGLAALCFMQAGFTHKYGPCKTGVRKALEYIISCQTGNGSINFENSHRHSQRCLPMGEGHGPIPTRYNHNIGTLALVEAYAMTNDPWLKPFAQKALEYSRATPDLDYPWSFYLEPTDIGPSSYYIMALMVAGQTDLVVSDKEISDCSAYLDKLTDKESGRIIHLCAIPWCFGGYDSTATGVFLRALLGSADAKELNAKAFEFLKPHPPEWNIRFILPKVANDITLVKGDILNFWYWHYGTLAYWHAGKDEYADWESKVMTQLALHQRVGGDLDGSWDPEGAWCGSGGRVYSTTFSILTALSKCSYDITK